MAGFTKEWTSQGDFEAGTLTQMVAAGGSLAIAEGYAEGWWRSEWVQAAGWDHHSRFSMVNTVPASTNVLFRFRSDTTANEAAEWSEWCDAILGDGAIIFDLSTWYANNPGASVGEYIQFEVWHRGS